MFLTLAELAELTGRKRAAQQVRWLAEAGIRCIAVRQVTKVRPIR